MKFALVIFDLDGTLVDSVKDIRAALVHALAEVAPADPELDERALGAAGLGLPLEEFFALARPPWHPASDEAARRRFIDAYRAYYHAHLLDRTRPFDGVVETLAALEPLRAQRGLRTAVATTKRTDTARRVIAGLGLERWFDAVLGTDGMAHKPAPDVLYAAARAVGREPATGLMVGDTGRDLQAGRAAGMKTCGVAWGVTGADGLRPLEPDWLIARFAELLPIING
jgi:phosphoglycolate phosphatase